MKPHPGIAGGSGIDRRVGKVLACLLIAAGIAPDPLHAYIDPVSGSLLLQLLAAGFLAVTVSFKRVWGKITTLIRSLKPGVGDD